MEKRELTAIEIDRVIEMAWEDRTPFEAITFQFGLSEDQVISLMRNELKPGSFKRWRQRVQGRGTKHLKLRDENVSRFKSSRQRSISGNAISKRKK
ncbi:TIGR03643 family protein [Robiginitalea sp.]|uniref:TIGR03643 family protein n=1 Tax=Robiginitalea sp. TaxID=1902411 RepID=UPI003C7876F5